MKGRHDEAKSSGHIGAILAAVTAITAGIYFFGMKKGKKQRIKLQDWVMKAEHDVMDRLEGVGEVNKEAFEAIVDAVLVNYKKAKKVDTKALAALRVELLSQWKGIEAKAKRGVEKTKKIIRIAKGG